jgi:hypothetical protein
VPLPVSVPVSVCVFMAVLEQRDAESQADLLPALVTAKPDPRPEEPALSERRRVSRPP